MNLRVLLLSTGLLFVGFASQAQTSTSNSAHGASAEISLNEDVKSKKIKKKSKLNKNPKPTHDPRDTKFRRPQVSGTTSKRKARRAKTSG